MTVLTPSNLEKVDYNQEGWHNIYNANWEKLNTKFQELLQATYNFASEAVIDEATALTAAIAPTQQTTTDSTTGTGSLTLNDVGATFSQSAINDNFASLAARIAEIKADIDNLKTFADDSKTRSDNLQSKINELIAVLRETDGVGVLSD